MHSGVVVLIHNRGDECPSSFPHVDHLCQEKISRANLHFWKGRDPQGRRCPVPTYVHSQLLVAWDTVQEPYPRRYLFSVTTTNATIRCCGAVWSKRRDRCEEVDAEAAQSPCDRKDKRMLWDAVQAMP